MLRGIVLHACLSLSCAGSPPQNDEVHQRIIDIVNERVQAYLHDPLNADPPLYRKCSDLVNSIKKQIDDRLPFVQCDKRTGYWTGNIEPAFRIRWDSDRDTTKKWLAHDWLVIRYREYVWHVDPCSMQFPTL